MKEIRHKLTGEVIYSADVDSWICHDFRGIDLSYAKLSGANLSDADLSHAKLSGANLSDAKLSGAKIKFDGKKLEIKSMQIFSNLYDYKVLCVIDINGNPLIGMGCKHYPLKYWENPDNFWNNLNEFPDDGSIKTLRRRAALDFAILYVKSMQEEYK